MITHRELFGTDSFYVRYSIGECCSTGRSMIPMEWFLLNVDVVGEEDTVNLYEDETQGGLVTVRSASIKRNGMGGRIQELGVPGCGTFEFTYGSDGKLVKHEELLTAENALRILGEYDIVVECFVFCRSINGLNWCVRGLCR